MQIKRETVQIALDALLKIIDYVPDGDIHADKDIELFEKAEVALREALAQPEPEPSYSAHGYETGQLYDAPPAPKVPEGWKLVPIEPTGEMLKASWDMPDTFDIGEEYKAMLAAAPEYKEAP